MVISLFAIITVFVTSAGNHSDFEFEYGSLQSCSTARETNIKDRNKLPEEASLVSLWNGVILISPMIKKYIDQAKLINIVGTSRFG